MDQNGWNNNWNQNQQNNWNNNPSGDGQPWDRYNSDSSHNSYHNQPTHTPYDQSFAIASLVLGLLSTAFGSSGLTIPLSALGILFAVLCYRKGKRFKGTARFGLILSIVGLIYGVGSLVHSVYIIFTDPTYLNQLNQLYEQMYGISLEEMLQQYYSMQTI